MGFIGRWVVTAVATLVAVWLVPGIEAVGGAYLGPAMFALALALVNATVRPVVELLSLPLTILTLGIFYLVINAIMLELASYLSREIFHAGITIGSFGSALVGAVIISVVALLVGGATGLS
ncbi:phage holin family protein [Olsenella sp. HMSC062G07]|uniref:phage holin family protein n=1 Tax=Olsenella sp. HMSC062G07 TaxID=1739330 RepID=UPI00143C7309|nr:phage holin family protein [Olsenella sp. HMSC062G07]